METRPSVEYILEYQEKTETTWNKITETITETTHTVTKLTTNKEYTFRVTAANEAGPGETSPTSPYIKITKPSAAEPPVLLEPLKSVIVGLGRNSHPILRHWRNTDASDYLVEK